MRRIALFKADFTLLTDRVEIANSAINPGIVKYGERYFINCGGIRYLETLPVVAIDFPNFSHELFDKEG